jgi:hypothetical protein
MKRRLPEVLLSVLFTFCAVTTAFSQPPEASGDQHQHQRMQMRGDFKGTAGEITEIKGDTLVLKTEQGTQTVKTTDKTMFRREGGEAKLADFKVGDRVIVGGEPGPNNTWAAAFVGVRGQGGGMGGGMMRGEFSPDQLGKKFIVGEVLKIDGTKITLKRPDGVEQTIEVDDDTSFRKGRSESITLADIKVGDHVGGRGEVKNGVFVPSVLNQGMGGGGRFMMQRPASPSADAKANEEQSKEDKK